MLNISKVIEGVHWHFLLKALSEAKQALNCSFGFFKKSFLTNRDNI
jgi:hypothetical protein